MKLHVATEPRKGTMVVDARGLRHGPRTRPRDVLLEPKGNIANDVLDEDWIVVGLHSHVTFVRPLQKRVDGSDADCSASSTNSSIQINSGSPVGVANASHIDRDRSSLVVSSVITDSFATRAQTRYGNAHTKNEVGMASVEIAHK